MPLPPHTALVELSTSHLVCLQSQILFLKQAGAPVDLFLSSRARGRSAFLNGADRIHFLDVDNGIGGRWRVARALRRAFLDLGVEAAVFNTAEGNHVRDFCLIAPPGIRYAGLLHHTNKLGRSFTQRVISRRIRRYYVLMDYLLDSLPEPGRLTFAGMSPVFHAGPPAGRTATPAAGLLVCIPGELEFRRRDYRGLAAALRASPPGPGLRFVLLGSARTSDGRAILEMFDQTGHGDHIRSFPDYVDQETFTAVLAESDLILPLTHPGIGLYDDYRYTQVSGSFLEALAYRCPMALDRSWSTVRGFQEISLFYEPAELLPVLNRLLDDRRPLQEIRERFSRSELYSFQYQQDRFLSLLQP